MATSKIKSLGYTASARTRCGTALTIPPSATECYVVVYVANSTTVMQTIVPLHTETAVDIYEGAAGTGSYFRASLGADQSFSVSSVLWYNQDRTSESYYQLFYR